MIYRIYTKTDCFTEYEVEAESKEEAEQKYENGEYREVEQEFKNEEIGEILSIDGIMKEEN